MTNVSMQQRPRLTTGALVQEGPVLLATKPFNGLDAPLAVAWWLATREARALRVVSVLEPNEGVVTADVPPLPSRYYDERTALSNRSCSAETSCPPCWTALRCRALA